MNLAKTNGPGLIVFMMIFTHINVSEECHNTHVTVNGLITDFNYILNVNRAR